MLSKVLAASFFSCTFYLNYCYIMKKRIIAVHLPQFHPFKENDEWWGKGFTEWTNVAKARPRFRGHYQPHIPADLGFYDLRLEESRVAQSELAREYGIYGFCYYHYWFNGHQLMERPLNEILNSGKPDFPFMICWANENWTKAWDGKEKQVLIAQDYNDEDDKKHINYLLDNYFCDPRYIKVGNKPVFCIYRSTNFPNIRHTIQLWRSEAAKKGIDLYLCRMESFGEYGKEYLDDGFDAAIEFQPHKSDVKMPFYRKLFSRTINSISRKLYGGDILPIVYDYGEYVNSAISRPSPDYKRFPCVTPCWDNSPRRKTNFFAFEKSTPQKYGLWLNNVLQRFSPYGEGEDFVFINAWNEWAEGNHLEPDLKWGRGYLEATKEAIDRCR